MLLLHFDGAFTFHVWSSTFIAELVFASAPHVIAALVFLDPELTFGALFKLFTGNKIKELFIIFRDCGGDFVLCAGHFIVPLASTVETVLFFALLADEPRLVALLKEKHVPTLSSRAP